jgi:hypothetical protein
MKPIHGAAGDTGISPSAIASKPGVGVLCTGMEQTQNPTDDRTTRPPEFLALRAG